MLPFQLDQDPIESVAAQFANSRVVRGFWQPKRDNGRPVFSIPKQWRSQVIGQSHILNQVDSLKYQILNE